MRKILIAFFLSSAVVLSAIIGAFTYFYLLVPAVEKNANDSITSGIERAFQTFMVSTENFYNELEAAITEEDKATVTANWM